MKSRRRASSAQSVGEGDACVSPEGLDVASERRHLERRMARDDGDGAVLDAGRHRFQAGGLGEAHDVGSGSAVVAMSMSLTGSSRSARCEPRRRRRAPPAPPRFERAEHGLRFLAREPRRASEASAAAAAYPHIGLLDVARARPSRP